jgi:hypothetical protein
VAYAHDIDPGTITFHDNAQNLRSKSVKKLLMLASYMILVFGLAEPGKAQADGRNTEHTFAQYADGRFFDGTYYRSTLLFTNPDSRSNGCVFRTYGVIPEMRDEFGNTVVTDTLRFTAPGSSWSVVSSTATQGFAAGAATLFCDYPVTAPGSIQLLCFKWRQAIGGHCFFLASRAHGQDYRRPTGRGLDWA